MSTPCSFRFLFDATCDNPNVMPYVAKLQWNSRLKRIEHVMYPMHRHTLSATSTHVFGEFTASPLDIIETRRGALTRKRKTLELLSRFIATPRGYLLFIGEGRDAMASERIGEYLQGTRSANELGPQPWDIGIAISDWKALDHQQTPTGPTRTRADYLLDRKRALEQEIHEITLELESLTSTATHR